MTARDVISGCPALASVCSDGNSNSGKVADSIIEALTAAGYRLVPPGGIDAETVDACIAVVSNWAPTQTDAGESLHIREPSDETALTYIEALRHMSSFAGKKPEPASKPAIEKE